MISKYRKIKLQALLLILLMVTILSSFRLYQDLQTHNEHLKNNVITQNRYIKALFSNEIKRAEEYYKTQANNILKNQDIIKAFKEQNRERLTELVTPIFYKLKGENQFFTRMHFHTKDHKSFLRVHKLDKFGDNLENIRPIITHVQTTKQTTCGFEIGKYDSDALTYRIVTPIFDGIEFLGVLEFGLNSRYIMQQVNQAIEFEHEVDRVETIFLVKTDLLKHQEEKIQRLHISDYTLIYKSELFENLFNVIDLQKDYEQIKYNEKIYAVSSDNVLLKSYDNKEAGKVIVIFDITNLKDTFDAIVSKSILIATIALIAFMFALNYAFSYFINKIQDSTLELETIFENSVLGILYIKNNKITKINKSISDIFGYSQDEMLEQEINFLYIDSNSYNNFYTNQKLLLAKRNSVKTEHRLIKKDGTIIWCQMSGKAINIENVDDGVIWIIEDITRKKELSHQLEFSEHYLKTIMDSQSNIIIVTDQNGIVNVNKAFFDFFDYKNIDEVLSINKDGFEFYIEHILKKDLNELLVSLVNFNTMQTVKIKAKNQEYIFSVSINQFKLYQNERNVIVFTDITTLYEYQNNLEHKIEEEYEKRTAQEKLLIKQSKMASMGEMIDAIAHQWKQPLATMSLFTIDLRFSAELGTLTTQKAIELEQKFKEQIDHLTSTLDEFRNFFRPDKAQERFSIYKATQEAMTLIKHELLKNNIEIDINIEKNIFISGAKNEYKHIILNLLSNAKDAFNINNIKNRKIQISSTIEDEYVNISVIDNAGGIPKHLLDTIFNANVTTKETQGGTGIGLYMTKIIIDNMQGEISVSNTDDGAKFDIKLKVT